MSCVPGFGVPDVHEEDCCLGAEFAPPGLQGRATWFGRLERQYVCKERLVSRVRSLLETERKRREILECVC